MFSSKLWRRGLFFLLITGFVVLYVSLFGSSYTFLPVRPLSVSKTDETVIMDENIAIDLYNSVRVICIILSMEKNLDTKTSAVNTTWANRCNKHYFIMTTELRTPDIINSEYPDNRSYLMHKVRSAFAFVHDKHMEDIDWVFKADDDTYAIIENLRFLLSHYDANKPGYLGFKFDKFVASGFMSGGAGYVISRQSLKQLVQSGIRENKCPFLTHEEFTRLGEDRAIAECLEKVNVPRLISRDVFGRDTFHPYQIELHYLGGLPNTLFTWCKEPAVEGRNCCSQFTISFHYTNPKSMLLMDHLLYKTSVYGRSVPTQMGKIMQVGQYKP
ncbi:hypothetical protein CHS0354_032566 [Potamilus streckersoni]|uniref:N-acetylgalactosaminide beta-1,3-galactosyltransferase n=1 Tax=Potamilus streckersoni TaxID=2493646 RepID=A0AAE0VZN0_9BIVA|nr:hypothetical protein CHS0354_032566 [Potamilus streckersoni]